MNLLSPKDASQDLQLEYMIISQSIPMSHSIASDVPVGSANKVERDEDDGTLQATARAADGTNREYQGGGAQNDG